MIDGAKVIDAQLSASGPYEHVFADGKITRITPVRLVPQVNDDELRVTLDGEWDVTRWPFEQPEDVLCTGDDGARWEVVRQPGKVFYCDPEECPANVENWNRVTLTHIDPDDGAVIRRRVRVPSMWTGRRVYLRFDAIYPAGTVYCNGHRLGEQLSGLTPVEWDVTDCVQPGTDAVITVRLLRKHRFVQMDMPRHAMDFAGLAQSACLHATELCQIADHHLTSELSENLSDATLTGKVRVHNLRNAPQTAALQVVVSDPDGEPVASVEHDVDLAAGQSADVGISLELGGVCPWNDEFPNLYRVDICLDTDTTAPQSVSFLTGFRRFEVRDQRPLMNGNPVKFRGVNHLTFHPTLGMVTPKEWLRQCLTLMKRANVNTIRTHFLGPPALAELCDELGIYLLQELPIDWGHDYVHDPACVGPVLQRLEGGIRRDRHHVSVVVWSVGNENLPRDMEEHDDFFNHLRTFDRFAKTLDPTRFTMFPPPGPANKIEGIFETRVGDIADTHYSFNLVRKFNETDILTTPKTWKAEMATCTRAEALAGGWSGVWFSSEYGIANLIPDLMNAPYASIISDTPEEPLSGRNTLQVFYDRLSREWGYMRDDPTCLGGAYFPWICAGVGDNPWGWVRWGEDSDWGVVTADLMPKPFFWAMRVLFSPVTFPSRVPWREGDDAVQIEIRNGYNQIDLSQCTLRVMTGGGGKYMTMMREWRDIPVACPPGETTTITAPLWLESGRRALANGSPVVCRCILIDPKGFRPITADVLVVPESLGQADAAMPIGPDAVA